MAQYPVIVANWKMHPASREEAKKLFAGAKRLAEKTPSASIIIAPPSLYLSELARSYKGRKIAFASQHAREGDTGAFTGEVSMAQVKDAGAKFAIVGHAERRAAGESNEDARRQIVSAFENGITPILCIGEEKRESDGKHLLFLKEQLRTALSDVPEPDLRRVVIAYEPVWAIGAAEPMSTRQMHEMTIFIRKMLVELKGQRGHAVKILYGGAIDELTARPMIEEADVDGLLVGRASTSEQEFIALINSLAKK